MASDKIFVTRPTLPPLDDYQRYLADIWDSRVLTNGGKFHQELERVLAEYLGVTHVSLFSSGTLALIAALKVLNLEGEVITTPFTFVATAHALIWNNLKPVFVDIDRKTLNIDPLKIEDAITEKTSAILPVHVYGQACDTESIDGVAKKHNLKVIYDAAHAFGVRCHCGSVLTHGDLSVLSFHATKVFNTGEGGAIVCHDDETKQEIDKLRNFGFSNEATVDSFGLNGKMSELSAALGLSQMPYIKTNLEKRRVIDQRYRHGLNSISGIRCLNFDAVIEHNYGYFPVLIDEGYNLSRDEVQRKLELFGIYTRRYFFPIIPDLSPFSSLDFSLICDVPVARDVANKILCLPIYSDLSLSTVDHIVDLLSSF